ncbi:MAG: HAMP domain-containing histidine kinase, partial [Campylobacteraceae bacterium]|nr:HAMP domain-containing histidine kinase [Campylobacteraceae bacterium]
PNTKISVDFSCNEDEFILLVENLGESISPDHTKEIYNRFVHFETGHTREAAGLGLGLSVALGMCEALEGKIDNKTEGEITQFIVNIPFISSEEAVLSEAYGSNEFMFDTNDGMMEF